MDKDLTLTMNEEAPLITRPSWHLMVAQLAGFEPAPIRVSDFGRGGRVVLRALSGLSEERDIDMDDDLPDEPLPAHH
jgi:hypothetical protein